jgi:hypothetical protein
MFRRTHIAVGEQRIRFESDNQGAALRQAALFTDAAFRVCALNFLKDKLLQADARRARLH